MFSRSFGLFRSFGAVSSSHLAGNAEVNRFHEVNRGLQTTSLPGNVHVQEDSENAAADGDGRGASSAVMVVFSNIFTLW